MQRKEGWIWCKEGLRILWLLLPRTFKRTLRRARDDDVKVAQVVLVRDRIDSRGRIGDQPLRLLTWQCQQGRARSCSTNSDAP